jgi:hypothetical protein
MFRSDIFPLQQTVQSSVWKTVLINPLELKPSAHCTENYYTRHKLSRATHIS